MIKYEVYLTEDAEQDLRDMAHYIQVHDSDENVEYVVSSIAEQFASLAEMPSRGVIPFELANFGIREYREVFFKPYRIIYRIHDERVVVYVIADGRRDMQSLLERRLLN